MEKITPLLWRLPQVLENFPVSRSHWLKCVEEGTYPQPVRLGPRCVAWRVSDVAALIDRLQQESKQ